MRQHAPAVQDGRLKHFSVSQLKDYIRCPRYWAGSKLFHFDRGETQGQNAGRDFHAEMENYYNGGRECSHPGVQNAPIPRPHSTLLVEHDLSGLMSVGNVPFTGHSDLIDPINPTVYDWKFTKNFRYVHSPEDDLQMICYARWAMERWNVDRVGVELWFFSGDEHRHRPGVITRRHADETWSRTVVPLVESMLALVQNRRLTFVSTPANFEKGFAACGQYGGCPYDNKGCGAQKRLISYDAH